MLDLSHWNVLLVDDEPDSLNLLHDVLSLNGAEVHRARGGQEGFALLKEFTPTLVIADLSMPKPDGWDLLGVIRSTPATAHVPVVAVTAFYSERVIDQAIRAGFTAFISKPFKVNALLSKLQEVVG